MWKRFKELVELLVNLQKLAPLLLGTLVIVVSIVAGLAGIGRLSVQINLSLPVIIAVSALALYPVAKFVQWWFRPLKPFSYSGLLWSQRDPWSESPALELPILQGVRRQFR